MVEYNKTVRVSKVSGASMAGQVSQSVQGKQTEAPRSQPFSVLTKLTQYYVFCFPKNGQFGALD